MNRSTLKIKVSPHPAPGKSLAMAAMLLLASVAPSYSFQEEELPSAEEVLGRYAESTGGREAHEKTFNRAREGTIEFKSMGGMEASFTSYEAASGRSKMVMDLGGGFGKHQEGTFEGAAWEFSTMSGPRVYEGKEKESALRLNAFDRYIRWRVLFERAENAGSEEVEGQTCYKILLTTTQGEQETWFFSKETGLLLKTEMVANSSLGAIRFENFLGDYREAEGLLLPHRERMNSSVQELVITFQKIARNVDLPEDCFDPPEEVERLLRDLRESKPAAKSTAEDRTAWIKENAILFETAEAESGFEDLEPLKELIRNARIVALGEGTHGTREFFRMKHRITEFLAREMGFTLFSIEANMPEAYRVGEYVLGGEGDPRTLIGGMYFWTWNTEEVLALVEWMRRFNQEGERKIAFTGFDMQFPDVAMEIAAAFAADRDPDLAAEMARTYRVVRAVGRPAEGGGFGVGTAQFPIDRAAGKKIVYSGWIKTEEITEGFAGLWWRVDGEAGILGFDNMQDRGLSGNHDWTLCRIEMEVPAEAVNINFGVIHPGNGTAWFDSLEVQVNGAAYRDEEQIDLGFESQIPRGFFTGGAGYEVVLDRDKAQGGAQSLRSRRLDRREDASKPMEASEAADRCLRLLDRLESSREKFLETASTKETEWAIQNARVVLQYAQLMAGQVHRDRSMALNVQWILDHAPPEAKIVLWAHNGHVNRIGESMGGILNEIYGDEMVVLGFACAEGRYTAMGKKGLSSDHAIAPPAPQSLEQVLLETGLPRLIIDLRKASREDPASAWLTGWMQFRTIGALAMEHQFSMAPLSQAFDGIIYFEKTTPSRLLTE